MCLLPFQTTASQKWFSRRITIKISVLISRRVLLQQSGCPGSTTNHGHQAWSSHGSGASWGRSLRASKHPEEMRASTVKRAFHHWAAPLGLAVCGCNFQHLCDQESSTHTLWQGSSCSLLPQEKKKKKRLLAEHTGYRSKRAGYGHVTERSRRDVAKQPENPTELQGSVSTTAARHLASGRETDVHFRELNSSAQMWP